MRLYVVQIVVDLPWKQIDVKSGVRMPPCTQHLLPLWPQMGFGPKQIRETMDTSNKWRVLRTGLTPLPCPT